MLRPNLGLLLFLHHRRMVQKAHNHWKFPFRRYTATYGTAFPPLSEQRRIVEILDRFDTLTNSISEGLPREIALRRKQYEYYRDALLRFPPPAPTA